MVTMASSLSPAASYRVYVQARCPDLDLSRLPAFQALDATNWDEPMSAVDCNNYGVVALLEAMQASDSSLRRAYVDMAIEAFTTGANLGDCLCAAHLALALASIGRSQDAMQVALSTFLDSLQPAYGGDAPLPPGILYWPETPRCALNGSGQFAQVLQQMDGRQQSWFVVVAALSVGQPIFYNATGLRLLQLAAQVIPDSAAIQLKLGLASLMNQQLEGLWSLHRAQQLAPDSALPLQALHLAYRDLGQLDKSEFWLARAREIRPATVTGTAALSWHWVDWQAPAEMTCIAFEQDGLLAIEPSLRSIATSVLLGAGTWFEAEMEFWRNCLQPGMTAIDVGANVGVYTIAAAQQVGPTGCAIAVEPFSGCVARLQQTCQLNQFSQVKILAGAASDRVHSAKLSLHTASELNELVAEDGTEAEGTGTFETVQCFPLDDLLAQVPLQRVDLLKIDAEGHELQVLAGSKRLLAEFAPVIFYENIAGNRGGNLPVADYLRSQGYQLFRYQPFIQQLVPVQAEVDFQQSLNLIAIPASKVTDWAD